MTVRDWFAKYVMRFAPRCQTADAQTASTSDSPTPTSSSATSAADPYGRKSLLDATELKWNIPYNTKMCSGANIYDDIIQDIDQSQAKPPLDPDSPWHIFDSIDEVPAIIDPQPTHATASGFSAQRNPKPAHYIVSRYGTIIYLDDPPKCAP